MERYEAVVVGGGPGGYVAAIRLGQLGVKTLLVEKEHLGGECLNYGCIPSKTLIGAVNKYWLLKSQGLIEGGLDWRVLQRMRGEVAKKMREGVRYLLEGNGVKVAAGTARLRRGMRVEVKKNGKEEVEAENLVIATGALPASLPSIPYDGNRVIGPKEALELPEVPDSLLVVGGGAIGLELGTMYAKLRVRLTVVEIMDQLLPGFEKDLARMIERRLRRLGAEVHLSSKVISSRVGENKIRALVETPKGRLGVETDYALVSVGKRAATQDLGLEELGVKTDERGFIQVDERARTNLENVYAVGDVTGPPFLAHKASRQGIVAAENIAGRDAKIDLSSIPSAIFTDPELAVVGLTRGEAEKRGIKVRVGRFTYSALGRAIADGEAEGFIRVVMEEETGKVLGVQILGAHASELIGEAALAVRLGLTAEELAETIHPHPTYSEALMEAAEAAVCKPIHMLVR